MAWNTIPHLSVGSDRSYGTDISFSHYEQGLSQSKLLKIIDSLRLSSGEVKWSYMSQCQELRRCMGSVLAVVRRRWLQDLQVK